MKNFKLSLLPILLLSFLSCKRSAESYCKEANDSLYMGNFKFTVPLYTKAIALKPDYALAYLNRGHAELGLLDYAACLKDCEKAIALDTSIAAPAYQILGGAKDALKDYRGALKAFDIAISKNPKNANFYFCRAMTEENVNNLAGALQDFNKSIALAPREASSYDERGKLKVKIKDKNGACLDFNKAFQLGDKFVDDDIKENCN